MLLSVWATFLLFGAIAAPVPGVNEPHYLCKAKHFWQPDWCSQDFFLASPNVHAVFYATIGGLTTVVSFAQSAWIGRALATLVLAWGWTTGLSRLFFTRWATLWCAWIFLALAACGNFSGEWLAGGVEGKVFSYGLLLAAFGDVLRERLFRAAIWTGLAISFHPVVGIWGLLAFSAARILQFGKELRSARNRISTGEPGGVSGFAHKRGQTPGHSVTIWTLTTTGVGQTPFEGKAGVSPRILWPFATLLVLALPGLIPVVRLLMEPVSEETRYTATYLQVYFRLAHHLDPMMFPLRAYLGYALLLAIWLGSLVWGGRTNSKKALDRIVVWAVVFAVVGILVGFGPRPAQLMPFFAQRMNLLKFYPFRLADVLLPIAVAVSLIGVLERTALDVPASESRRFRIAIPHAVMWLVLIAGLWRASATTETNRYSNEDRADWIDVCRWIDEHLPVDALVQSPTNGWAFKWFAKRAEYVAFKDCPQDSAGIVEWNRRLNFLHHWYEEKYADNFYSASELRELRRETGLTHLLTDRLGPLELEPIYRNQTFQVYDLRKLER